MGTGRARIEPLDLSERGGLKDGEPQRSDERLFMQLLVFTGCRDVRAVRAHIAALDVDGVVYEDLNDPLGVAVLTASTNPDVFIDVIRPAVVSGPMEGLTQKPQFSMFGRVPIRSATSRI